MNNNIISTIHALGTQKKSAAMEVYKDAIKAFASNEYEADTEDYFAIFSADFGTLWQQRFCNGEYELYADLYAEANAAFNYAHIAYGAGGGFVKNAKKLLKKHQRCNDKYLRKVAKGLDFVATAVTREETIERALKAGVDLNVAYN